VRPHRSSSLRSMEIPSGGHFDSFRRYERTWIVGPRVQVDLTERLGVVAEANYRQIRFRETTASVIDTNPLGTVTPPAGGGGVQTTFASKHSQPQQKGRKSLNVQR
jgi:hypothetical protein